jgi:hypothetical protein
LFKFFSSRWDVFKTDALGTIDCKLFMLNGEAFSTFLDFDSKPCNLDCFCCFFVGNQTIQN